MAKYATTTEIGGRRIPDGYGMGLECALTSVWKTASWLFHWDRMEVVP